MLGKSLFLAGTVALQAVSAFVIPPEPSGRLIKPHAVKYGHTIVELDCPQCPFAGPNGNGSAWMQDQGLIKIRLDLDIGRDHHYLQVNGQPIFPRQSQVPVPLSAVQIRTSDGSETAPLRLGYVVETMPAKAKSRRVSDTMLQLYIFNIHGIPLKVDVVQVDVRQGRRRTTIGDVTIIPYAQSPGAERCDTARCRLRAIMIDHIRKILYAAKTHTNKAKTWVQECCRCGIKRVFACAGRTQHKAKTWFNKSCNCAKNFFAGHGHGKGHRHQHQSRLGHLVSQTIHFVLLPAVVGVFGGLAACAFGMLLGRGLALVMNRRRGATADGDAPPLAHPNVQDAVADDEKDGLLVTNEEMPPQYTDADVVEKQ